VPGGSTWRHAVEQVPAPSRHLAIHENHLVAVTDRDRPAVVEAASRLPARTFTGTVADLRARVNQLGADGVTEIIYQPAGPDISGELERFVAAVG
jgi:5,10-methylenetetrahydromethanopterin reductase